MASRKQIIMAGAAVAGLSAIGVGGLSTVMVSAAPESSSNGGNSLVDKIAAKFNLNKSDVQAVFDQDRSEHQAAREANMQAMLAKAVTDGKLTQSQADHITQALKDIKDTMGDNRPDQLDDATKQQLKAKTDALRQWAKDNNIDMRYVRGMMGHSKGGMMHGDKQPANGATDTKPEDATNQ